MVEKITLHMMELLMCNGKNPKYVSPKTVRDGGDPGWRWIYVLVVMCVVVHMSLLGVRLSNADKLGLV